MLVDPTDKEEVVMNGRMIMAMNIHREICGAVMGGGVSLESEQILRCSKIASVKVTEIVALIQEALEEDSKQRALGKTGLLESDVAPSIITVTSADESEVDISEVVENVTERQYNEMTTIEENPWGAQLKGPGTAQIGEGGDNSWIVLDDADEEMEESEIISEKRTSESPTPVSQQKNGGKVVQSSGDSDDSEEEDVVILTAERSDVVQKSSQPTSTLNTLDLSRALRCDSEKNSNNKKKKKKKKSGNRISQTS